MTIFMSLTNCSSHVQKCAHQFNLDTETGIAATNARILVFN